MQKINSTDSTLLCSHQYLTLIIIIRISGVMHNYANHGNNWGALDNALPPHFCPPRNRGWRGPLFQIDGMPPAIMMLLHPYDILISIIITFLEWWRLVLAPSVPAVVVYDKCCSSSRMSTSTLVYAYRELTRTSLIFPMCWGAQVATHSSSISWYYSERIIRANCLCMKYKALTFTFATMNM